MEVRDPLRHYRHYQQAGAKDSPYAGGSSHVFHFLSRSWHGLLNGNGFDPAPFILLLQKNTALIEQIHTLTEQLTALTEEVHRATCRGSASAPAPS